MRITTLIFLTSLFSLTDVFAQWEQCKGIYGADVTCFASVRNTIFAGARSGGVYRSSNNGESWERSSNGLGKTLVIDFGNIDTTLFVVTSNVVFRSDNLGDSWYSTGLEEPWINKIRTKDTILFVEILNQGVYKSTDYGKSWIKLEGTSTIKPEFLVEIIGSRTFAKTQLNDLIYSDDLGITWNNIGMGLKNEVVRSMAKKGNYIFAGTHSGVFRSSNNGISWQKTSLGYSQVYVLDTIGSLLLATGTNCGGVIQSKNNGDTWTTSNKGIGDLHIQTLTIHNNNIFIGTQTGIYVKKENEGTWHEAVKGLTSLSIYDLKFVKNTLFAGTINGLFKSSNYGMNWTNCNIGDISAYLVESSNSNIFVASEDGILQSDIDKNSWRNVNSQLNYFDVSTLATLENSIYVGTFYSLYMSSNNGSTWTTLPQKIAPFNVISVNDKTMYAGTYAGVFMSTDSGISWTSIGLSDPITSAISSGKGRLLVGTTSGGDAMPTPVYSPGVFLSEDDGSSWTNIGLSDKDIIDIKTIKNVIIVGTNRGLFITTDNGIKWDNLGLDGEVSCISTDSNTVYVGTYNLSILKRDLSAFVSTTPNHIKTNEDTHAFNLHFDKQTNALNIWRNTPSHNTIPYTIANQLGIITDHGTIPEGRTNYSISIPQSQNVGMYFLITEVNGVRQNYKFIIK